jgi:hypothetical protein
MQKVIKYPLKQLSCRIRELHAMPIMFAIYTAASSVADPAFFVNATKNLKKITAKKNLNFLDQKMQFTYP